MIHANWQELGRFGRFVALHVLLLVGQTWPAPAEEGSRNVPDPSGVTDVVTLDESELNESSGLAISERANSERGALYFWSHNDSGGDAKLYAFDRKGRKSGHVKFTSAAMDDGNDDDWEDMAGYLDQGVPRLLVADCGDNDSKRRYVRLYLFDEPDPTKKTTLSDKDVQTIRVTYPDGPNDCEAVAVDVARETIILVTKTRLPFCGVYTIPLPRRDGDSGDYSVTATRVASLPIPMVTAMDIDSKTGDLWVVSYFQAFCFRCPERHMLLQRQFSALPDPYELPRWRQIEAVAIDRSNSVWVTSEGKYAPLGRLSPEALAGQKQP